MSKVKLDVGKLLKGMYVSELDCPWDETSFLFQGFRITNLQEIEQLLDSFGKTDSLHCNYRVI